MKLRSVFIAIVGITVLSWTQAGSQAWGAPNSIPANSGTVELHAHLFMKEGMTWGFHGDFFGPLRAQSWEDKFSSQANPDALDKSGLSVVVATLYAHPLFTLSLRDSIRRQIELARKFVLPRPDWVLATEPDQAQQALAQGKHVMILALEGASGILETEDDLREFIDEGGIRIVGPLHLTDDEFGGVAFLAGWHVLSDPFAWLFEIVKKTFVNHPENAVLTNENGLTEKGRAIIKKLLDRHVWIDLAHASDPSMKQMIEMMEPYHQPLIYTHTVLRKYHHAERGVPENILHEIQRTGGILGLMPSEEMLAGAPVSASCPSSVYALTQEYREIADILGSDSVMMGSDYNGGIPHLKPGCPSPLSSNNSMNSAANTASIGAASASANESTGSSDSAKNSLTQSGLWNMSQIPDLWSALRQQGAPVPNPLSKMADRFVAVWKKVR